MKHIATILFALSGLLGFPGAPLFAQAATDAVAPKPRTTASPDIDVKELDLRLRPLTKAELEVELTGWMTRLVQTVAAHSDAEIGILRTQDAAKKEELIADKARLHQERTRLVDRAQTVMAALTKKGGKVEEQEKYIAAVEGLTLDVADATAAWSTIVNWLKSPEGGIRYGKNIGLFLLTLLVFRILAAVAGRVADRGIRRFGKTSELLRDFFVNAVRKVTVFVGFVFALSMLEVNIGPFLAAMGAAGFVIGFALQGTLSNFAAGIMILLYRPYDIGDTVQVAGVKGRVQSMSLVSTVIINEQNQTVTIPNGSIWGGIITNIEQRRLA